MRFGYGLGDLGMIGEHVLIFLIISGFGYALRKKWAGNIIAIVAMLLASAYIILTLTIWRGVEYPWRSSEQRAPGGVRLASAIMPPPDV
ncbi:MAG: hypothetical protein ABIR47_02360 [Candidatus Kapaibacterium sp.]